MTLSKGYERVQAWYQTKGWTPFTYQENTLSYFLSGYSGIVNAPTGMGKTEAIWLPALASWIDRFPEVYQTTRKNGLRVLWITPLRALAKDIEGSLQGMCDDLQIPWRIGRRTGDTSSNEREKQKRNMPEALVITPESLQLLLATKNYPKLFENLEVVVVDEDLVDGLRDGLGRVREPAVAGHERTHHVDRVDPQFDVVDVV